MNALRFTEILAVVALALVLPAWAIAPSEQAKTNATTASDQANQPVSSSEGSTSTQGDTMDSGKAQDKDSADKQGARGPTAIMDRATPVEKSGKGDAAAKHPPTGRMDQTVPDQKSPTTGSGSETQPSSAAK